MATIEKRSTARGTRYRVRWWSDGRAIEKWVATEHGARALKVQAESDSLDGIAFDPRPGRRVLNDYFDEWLENRLVKGRPIAATTRHGYAKLWKRHVEAGLGLKRLRSVTPEAVRTWHAAIVRSSSQDQAAKAYRVLRAVMRTAEADDLIRANPCRIKGAGQEHHDERPMVATSLVLKLADAIGEQHRALVMLAGFAGLRTGESLALRRCDVNLLHAEVRVIAQSQELDGAQEFVERTKSDAGRRTVALPRVVCDVLDRHLADFTPTAAGALLFTSPLGHPERRASVSTAWRAAVKATGAPKNLRLHDLRHHAATLTARMPGITTKELMARIGHASPRAALIYQHATAERDRAIASFLDVEIAGAESTRGAGAGLG